ncbi:hypothetical protein BCR44DRAFT_50169, partial [Catenaria anguillulae PL171]
MRDATRLNLAESGEREAKANHEAIKQQHEAYFAACDCAASQRYSSALAEINQQLRQLLRAQLAQPPTDAYAAQQDAAPMASGRQILPDAPANVYQYSGGSTNMPLPARASVAVLATAAPMLTTAAPTSTMDPSVTSAIAAAVAKVSFSSIEDVSKKVFSKIALNCTSG